MEQKIARLVTVSGMSRSRRSVQQEQPYSQWCGAAIFLLKLYLLLPIFIAFKAHHRKKEGTLE
jgi:hypothetical protein